MVFFLQKTLVGLFLEIFAKFMSFSTVQSFLCKIGIA